MLTATLCAAVLAPAQVAPFTVVPKYVYPQDQTYHPEYLTAIKKTIVEVQDWYREKAGVTFKLAPVEVLKAPDYATLRGGPNPSEEVKKDIQKMPRWWESLEEANGGYKGKTVYWLFAQGGGGFAAANLIRDWTGIGIFGDWVLEPISGVREPKAIHSGFATWQVQGGTPVGTTVHELGHAFGLHHPDKYPGKSIMRWHGDYPTTGLMPHEIMILRNSPYFVKNAYDEDGPWLNFENQDYMNWGETVTLKGKRFKEGVEVEFRTVATADFDKANKDNLAQYERTVRIKPTGVKDGELTVTVPTGIGPGFIRIWDGKKRSNIVPVNFYKPE